MAKHPDEAPEAPATSPYSGQYVRLANPEPPADGAANIAIVRTEHVDAYLEAGFTLAEGS